LIKLSNGELMLDFNMERGLQHSDSGQSCDASTFRVVWPWTVTGGNWNCAFAQTSEGAILMRIRVASFIAPSALRGGSD